MKFGSGWVSIRMAFAASEFCCNPRLPTLTATILPATAPDGYSGSIDLVVGINVDGSIAGVRALSHRETPGLGDKVDIKKSDWILGFNTRSLADPLPAQWKVKKDKGVFDQFTGATITPRAVVAATLRVLQFAQANHAALFGERDQNPKAGE